MGFYFPRDVAQSGSAPALGAGGPRFESWYPDLKIKELRTKVCNSFFVCKPFASAIWVFIYHGSRLRLDHNEGLNPQTFGSKPYSREELVAEMGASFRCSSAQIDYDNIAENNAAYLAGWLNKLKADSKFIFKAAAEAQKTADYFLNRKHTTGD